MDTAAIDLTEPLYKWETVLYCKITLHMHVHARATL